MEHADRYERANRILEERRQAAQRHVAALAIQGKSSAESKAAKRQQQAAELSDLALTVLEKLDQNDPRGHYNEVETVTVRTKGRFGRTVETDQVGFNVVDDDRSGKYYLFLDGTFAVRPDTLGVYHGGPNLAEVVPPEYIVSNPGVHDAMLRSLRGLGDL